MSQLVAVYGSLRQGMGNHRLLIGEKFIDFGTTVDHIALFDYAGCFPAIAGDRDAETGEVNWLTHNTLLVEVYEVSDEDLTGKCDRLEGYPDFYDRVKVPVKLKSGETVEAWIYFLKSGDVANKPLVETGDWVTYKIEQQQRDW